MLFSFDNDFILEDYFNLNKKTSDILSPKEGQMIGNMFYNEYDGYKNYKPKEVVVTSDKERLLQRIRELDFAVNDLLLALDLDPNNKTYYELFKKYVEEENACIKKYSEDYSVICVKDDTKGVYTWEKGPWPWEGERYV